MATGDLIGPVNLQSGKVTKGAGDSSGKTADRGQQFVAPSDHFIDEASITVHVISAHGKNAFVHLESVHKELRTFILPDGSKYDLPVVTSFVARAHAETGSGYSGGDITAWAEGEVSYKIVEYTH